MSDNVIAREPILAESQEGAHNTVHEVNNQKKNILKYLRLLYHIII